MNYLKLNIGGKERGAKIGLLFLEKVQKAENMNIQELFNEFDKNPFSLIPKLIYHSLIVNCELKGEEKDFTIEQVYDEVGENMYDENSPFQLFKNAFIQSVIKLLPPNHELRKDFEEGKPKPTKKASTPTSGNKK